MPDVTLRITEPEERLDRLIAKHCPELSRSMVQRLIREASILVNGVASKPSYLPIPGDLVQVNRPDETPLPPVAEELPVCIVYEDECLLVVNKPAGLVVHPGPGHAGGTLVNALLAHRPDLASVGLDPQRPGIVHRLDRDTSGLLLVAARREAQDALQAQFRAHTVEKTYLVLLEGHLVPAEGAIEAPIGRDPQDRMRRKVVAEGGRYARTEYRMREYLRGYTYTEARPLTGRTHQLRVHFAAIGHPVVGDQTYGRRRGQVPVPRQFLHAWQLTFVHPLTGERLVFFAELPADLADVLDRLRSQGST